MIHYVCKYTPIELFAGFGEQAVPLETMREDYPAADKLGHQNLCGFGKSVIEAVADGGVHALVLTNCCDVMRRVYDILQNLHTLDFLFLLDLPHGDASCARNLFAAQLVRLKDSLAAYTGRPFDEGLCRATFSHTVASPAHYVGLIGSHISPDLQAFIETSIGRPTKNLSCIAGRNVPAPSGDDFWQAYAQALLSQAPCRRMGNIGGRTPLYEDPRLEGIVSHAIKFCDFAQSEYPEQQAHVQVPCVQIQTDFTTQSEGQLATRLEAFGETLGGTTKRSHAMQDRAYVAGIDSGSTSTDVVVMDHSRKIVASMIIPTGGGAQKSAETCLSQALAAAGIDRNEVGEIVATGYGRDYLKDRSEAVTEISCHAKGAWFLDPAVRTIIDIGGQDSKAIRIDGSGQVVNFAMNDKCAAGTGRFLEAMARTLGLSLAEMAGMGVECDEDLTISSMCTVFAESEVVSLVAQNKKIGDIIHALDRSVANKVASLVNRVGLEEKVMITGGVSLNRGVVHAIDTKLGITLEVLPEAQLCGAIGAALFALAS